MSALSGLHFCRVAYFLAVLFAKVWDSPARPLGQTLRLAPWQSYAGFQLGLCPGLLPQNNYSLLSIPYITRSYEIVPMRFKIKSRLVGINGTDVVNTVFSSCSSTLFILHAIHYCTLLQNLSCKLC